MERYRRERLGGSVGTAAGSAAVEARMRAQLAACSEGESLVQVCCVDHAGPGYERSPHLHVQALFSDRSRSPWQAIQNVSLADLRDKADSFYILSRGRVSLSDERGEVTLPYLTSPDLTSPDLT